ncbi:trehalose phosphate synthase [Rhynchospora pubera]|uniref:Trehalose phosphate synthase n=1 Tax=Rhynchospora pubera TaxID=906938 RepID=A0AAV8BQ26_9POAL|nr:trehalose phosphate synthase [Rhynchospora pubera]
MPSLSPPPRRIIISHRLPLRSTPDPSSPFQFSFSLDPDSLPLQLSSSLPSPPLFVGTLSLPSPSSSLSDELSQHLLSTFSCLPVFLPSDLHHHFYHRFCKHYLWPLLHYLLPLSPSSHGGLPFESALYRSYLSANKLFADRITEILNPEEDFVWVHDYHLIALPTFLRKRFPCVKLGFFLHSPFPSSEIFRTIPVRDDLLRALLNSDMVGFHTFDYARHFLSSCSRLLGLGYQSKRGYIGLEYYGRNIIVKILPVGIDMGQLQSVVSSPETASKIRELKETYKDRVLIVGVDDVDIFKGIGLKFLAMEKLLEERPELQGRAILIQITNPARSQGKDIQEVRDETHSIRDRINTRFGQPGYQPVVVIENRPVPMYEKAAFYAMAECCVMNAVRDGLNRIPYTYTLCRELSPALSDSSKKSVIVLSEFVGCSPSLSGAIRVNPWNIESVSEAMYTAISMSEVEKQLRHEKHYKYISTHDVAYWAQSFDQDLQRACQDHSVKKNCYGIGFGMSFRVVALGPGFNKLLVENVVSGYRKTCSRLVLLDYDGTMVPQSLIDKRPSEEVIQIVNRLCADPSNVVFVVSGRGKDDLAKWFEPCEKLGIAAEHGYYIRWNRDSQWETSACINTPLDFDWMKVVLPVMRQYTEATDGSHIEQKDSALVWHHQEADPDFGLCQAKELLDHLEKLLANEPVVVKRGHHIVEVTPQGISKGVVVETIISAMQDHNKAPDFVLCVGDDTSDEDMFEAVRNCANKPEIPKITEVFPCTVGNKPSMAKYYLDDTVDVLKMLRALADTGQPGPGSSQSYVSFDDPF